MMCMIACTPKLQQIPMDLGASGPDTLQGNESECCQFHSCQKCARCAHASTQPISDNPSKTLVHESQNSANSDAATCPSKCLWVLHIIRKCIRMLAEFTHNSWAFREHIMQNMVLSCSGQKHGKTTHVTRCSTQTSPMHHLIHGGAHILGHIPMHRYC